MRKAAELVVLGKRSLCPDRLKAPGGRLLQPGQRILREDIPQQSYTLLPQLRCWIIGHHIASVEETARLWRRLDLDRGCATWKWKLRGWLCIRAGLQPCRNT